MFVRSFVRGSRNRNGATEKAGSAIVNGRCCYGQMVYLPEAFLREVHLGECDTTSGQVFVGFWSRP